MDDDLLYFLVIMGVIVLIVFLTIAWFCYLTAQIRLPRLAEAQMDPASQQDIQRQPYPEMAPPTQNPSSLRCRSSRNGNSSSDEDRYSSRETVAIDEIASGSQTQSRKSNKKSKGQSQTKSEDESLNVVYLGNTQTADETAHSYYMSSDNKIKIESGKFEERDTVGEPNSGQAMYEECDCKASESNISNSAGTSRTQDSKEVDNTVIENESKCETSNLKLDTVDNATCSKEYEAGGENNSEVEA